MISIIEQEYKWCSNGMQEDKKALYMPVLRGIIINLNKNKLLINTGVFLVDSGAAISILGPKYTKLFQDDTPCDSQRLQYVGVDEEKIRNIYKAKIKIEGFSFDLRVAIEEEFNLNFDGLLGHLYFLDTFDIITLNPEKRTTKLIFKESNKL